MSLMSQLPSPMIPIPENPDQRKLPPLWLDGFDPVRQCWYYVSLVSDDPVTMWMHPLDFLSLGLEDLATFLAQYLCDHLDSSPPVDDQGWQTVPTRAPPVPAHPIPSPSTPVPKKPANRYSSLVEVVLPGLERVPTSKAPLPVPVVPIPERKASENSEAVP